VDFDDDPAWERVRDAALAPLRPGGAASLVVIEDRAYEGLDLSGLAKAPEDYGERVLIVFDAQTRKRPDNPLLVIDWLAEIDEEDEDRYIPRSMRATPEQVLSIEVNLSIANMDFDDYVANADPDGVFRGFR